MKRSSAGFLSLAGVIAALAIPAVAEAAPCTNYAAQINSRLENQKDRIQQGNRAGDLSRREDYALDARDTRVRLQEQTLLARQGHITTAQDVRLNHELNGDSRAIYRDKHYGF